MEGIAAFADHHGMSKYDMPIFLTVEILSCFLPLQRSMGGRISIRLAVCASRSYAATMASTASPAVLGITSGESVPTLKTEGGHVNIAKPIQHRSYFSSIAKTKSAD